MLTMRSSSASASGLWASTAETIARSVCESVGVDCAWDVEAATHATTGRRRRSNVDMTTNLLPALGLCALLSACHEAPRAERSAGVSDVTQVALTGGRNLRESSGAAMSRDHPGLIYTIEDSGNQPKLFAFDTTGADRGTWVVANATNVDWE